MLASRKEVAEAFKYVKYTAGPNLILSTRYVT
jgi:hypothetical protein